MGFTLKWLLDKNQSRSRIHLKYLDIFHYLQLLRVFQRHLPPPFPVCCVLSFKSNTFILFPSNPDELQGVRSSQAQPQAPGRMWSDTKVSPMTKVSPGPAPSFRCGAQAAAGLSPERKKNHTTSSSKRKTKIKMCLLLSWRALNHSCACWSCLERVSRMCSLCSTAFHSPRAGKRGSRWVEVQTEQPALGAG